MAYTLFDDTKPDASSQTPTNYDQSTRDNLIALRDQIVFNGFLEGWNFRQQEVDGSGSVDGDQPASLVFANGLLGGAGIEHLRLKLTWGTTGGEEGNVIQIVSQHNPSFSSWTSGWDVIGTMDLGFNSNGQLASWSWQ